MENLLNKEPDIRNEQGTKRSIEETSESSLPRKKLKSTFPNIKKLENQTDGSHEDITSLMFNGHSPGSSTDTIDDPSLNEPDSNPNEIDWSSDEQDNNNSLSVILTHKAIFKETEIAKLQNHEKLVNNVSNKALSKNSSINRDAKIISTILPSIDYSIICEMLEDNRDRENRLDIVTSQLSELTHPPLTKTEINSSIIEEVQYVTLQVPKADANEVYNLLESLPPSPSRIEKVVIQLKNKMNERDILEKVKPPLVRKISSLIEDPQLADDPLFLDMRYISKMFPAKDQNEIYALLEANYNKENRVQLVIHEILSLDKPSLEEPDAALSPLDSVHGDVEKVKIIFPDCDPNYIYERLYSMNEINRTDILVADMFEKKNYPKLKDLIEQDKIKQRQEKAKNLDLTVEDFLQIFPQPVQTFKDINKEVSKLYRNLAEVVLKNEFPMLSVNYINSVLRKHNGHLYPAYQEISADVIKIPKDQWPGHKRFQLAKKRSKLPLPPEVDEYFYHELWFTRNEQNVFDHPKRKDEERRCKVYEAKLMGEIYECPICCEDECLFEELASCPDGHLFCKICIIRSTEAAFGEMKVMFPCLREGCDQTFSLNTLQAVLSSNLFSKIVRRIQEEEVQKANIPDLVTCPFCPFATIMPNPDDKVLKCFNPDCLKESCRLCQEQNHIPLRCNEIEKKAETDMRTFIENQISEAVMRKCHKCGKRFVKETGCNKMTCVCGATSCYACKAKDIDYSHFNSNKCGDTNVEKIHQRDMEEAAQRARDQYILDHPEAAHLELKTDINSMIKNAGKNKHHNITYEATGFFLNYAGDSDDSEDDSDSLSEAVNFFSSSDSDSDTDSNNNADYLDPMIYYF